MLVGPEVHVTSHDDAQTWRLADVGPLEMHRCSVTDPAAVNVLVDAIRPRSMFHLAAHGAYAHQIDTARMVDVNTLGTFNVLDALDRFGGCEGFVHTGSSSEYGLKDHAATEDEELVEPDSVYAITKCAATHAVSYRARRSALPAATVRLYSVYGPWEEPTRRGSPTRGRRSCRFTPAALAPATARDFVWVDDGVDGILRAASNAARKPGAVWNLGSGVQTSLEQLVAIVCDVFGVSETRVGLDGQPGVGHRPLGRGPATGA